MAREPHRMLDPELGDRNIFLRIGLTREEWDKLEALGIGQPAEAAEKVLETALEVHYDEMKEFYG